MIYGFLINKSHRYIIALVSGYNQESNQNSHYEHVVARRVLTLPAEAISCYEETASVKIIPALAGDAWENASQRHNENC
jgi:hypothetical protein